VALDGAVAGVFGSEAEGFAALALIPRRGAGVVKCI
jgi:hypothetical protein